MARYDFRATRLFVDAPLEAGGRVALDREAANYLRNVLRLESGDPVLLFNGRDGEWVATLDSAGKRSLDAVLGEQARPQPAPGDLHYLFAPIKHARLDYMVQKAVEMGVSKLAPVITRHTNAERVNVERMRANPGQVGAYLVEGAGDASRRMPIPETNCDAAACTALTNTGTP